MADDRAKVLVGVRGMDSSEAGERVMATLRAVPGVLSVAPSDAARLAVEYDPTEATAMDLIRALRRIGFLAGME